MDEPAFTKGISIVLQGSQGDVAGDIYQENIDRQTSVGLWGPTNTESQETHKDEGEGEG